MLELPYFLKISKVFFTYLGTQHNHIKYLERSFSHLPPAPFFFQEYVCLNHVVCLTFGGQLKFKYSDQVNCSLQLMTLCLFESICNVTKFACFHKA